MHKRALAAGRRRAGAPPAPVDAAGCFRASTTCAQPQRGRRDRGRPGRARFLCRLAPRARPASSRTCRVSLASRGAGSASDILEGRGDLKGNAWTVVRRQQDCAAGTQQTMIAAATATGEMGCAGWRRPLRRRANCERAVGPPATPNRSQVWGRRLAGTHAQRKHGTRAAVSHHTLHTVRAQTFARAPFVRRNETTRALRPLQA